MTNTMKLHIAVLFGCCIFLAPILWYTYNENSKKQWLAQGVDYHHIALISPTENIYPDLPNICRQRDVHVFTVYDDKGNPSATRCIFSLWQLLFHWEGGLEVIPAVDIEWKGSS